MRGIALALVLFAVPLAALARPYDEEDVRDAPAVIDRGAVADQLSSVDALIADAIARARGRQEAQKTLRRAREQLHAVREQVNAAPNPREWVRAQRDPGRWFDAAAEASRHAPPQPAPPPRVATAPPPAPAVSPISDAALAQLLSAVDQQPSSLGRLRTLQQSAPANYFLVRQVQVLLARLPYAPDQVQAARLLEPRVLDRENVYQLNGWLQGPGPQAGLVERASFEARSSVRLQPGLYRGNFTVAGTSITVEGAGRDQTIIDGNVVINNAFNTVKGLTVLGKVIITGNQNHVRDVDYRAGIEDRGLMNKY